MESILEKLCWFYHDEYPNNMSEDLKNSINKFFKYEDILSKCLTDKELVTFNKLLDASEDMTAYTETDSFINGVKFGAKLIFELFVD